MSPEMETPEKYEPIPVGRYADALGMIDKLRRERDELKAKLTQVEADAAVMRIVIEKYHSAYGFDDSTLLKEAMSGRSGQRLLDELAERNEEISEAVKQLRQQDQELATLRDTAKRRLELLKKVEWVGFGMCWICGNNFNIGHKPDCPLAAELEAKLCTPST